MKYEERRAPAALAPYVECIWLLEGQPNVPALERIVPDGCAELILHLGDRFQGRAAEGLETQPRSFLVGQMTRPLEVRAGRRVRTLGIRFRPGGAQAFLRIPLHELTDRVTSLEGIWGREARELEDQLRESRSPIRTVCRFLQARRHDAGDRAVEAAVARIVAQRGQVRVASLGEAAGLSGRQLERRFQTAVGLPPKLLCRIVRFQSVFHRLGTADGVDWVGVALDSGYSDQAHLIRDFRDLAGETPARYLAGAGELARRFTSPARLDAFFDVAFVQDGA